MTKDFNDLQEEYRDTYGKVKIHIDEKDSVYYENLWKSACKAGYHGCLEDFIKMKENSKFSINENVNHPSHYGGKDNPYEAIKVIEAWLGIEGLKGFCLGNALKYTSQAGKKEGNSEQQDRDKAIWYIDYYNNRVKELNEKKS